MIIDLAAYVNDDVRKTSAWVAMAVVAVMYCVVKRSGWL